jgi:hypothetical protein
VEWVPAEWGIELKNIPGGMGKLQTSILSHLGATDRERILKKLTQT